MNSGEMRLRAKQCRLQVEAISDDDSRQILREIADLWQALADRYDQLGFWVKSELDRQTDEKDPSELAS